MRVTSFSVPCLSILRVVTNHGPIDQQKFMISLFLLLDVSRVSVMPKSGLCILTTDSEREKPQRGGMSPHTHMQSHATSQPLYLSVWYGQVMVG